MFATFVPVGGVLPYAGPVNAASNNANDTAYPDPDSQNYNLYLEENGWLVCDGRAIPIAKYPELFRIIGFAYGNDGDGKFLLPDYRGRFLRGVDNGAKESDNTYRDPDYKLRTASGEGGWAGGLVGSVQGDALQVHQHNYQMAKTSGIAGKGKPVFGKDTEKPTTIPNDNIQNNEKYKDVIVNTSTETRPKNVYINFIIKYTSNPHSFDVPLDEGLGCIFDAKEWQPY